MTNERIQARIQALAQCTEALGKHWTANAMEMEEGCKLLQALDKRIWDLLERVKPTNNNDCSPIEQSKGGDAL